MLTLNLRSPSLSPWLWRQPSIYCAEEKTMPEIQQLMACGCCEMQCMYPKPRHEAYDKPFTCVLKIVSSVILVFWRTLRYYELEYISIFSWSKFLVSFNEKWLKPEEYFRNVLAIFHLFIWEQFCVQLWEFHLHISKKKDEVKKVKIKTTLRVFFDRQIYWGQIIFSFWSQTFWRWHQVLKVEKEKTKMMLMIFQRLLPFS